MTQTSLIAHPRLDSTALTSEAGRKLVRLRRWEFWPSWAIYAPLLPSLAWYALRFGGLTVFTAANPGIPTGGLVGESKWDILRALPPDSITPSAFIPPGPREVRIAALAAAEKVGPYPLILKPDIGARGAGVRLARSRQDAIAVLDACAESEGIIVQRYHPGPFEAGVFYVRKPGEHAGRIFSITDKVFPRVIGDGVRSIRELIESHDRLSLQAPVFLARLGQRASRVPLMGEAITLGIAGNHCQGTTFLDGTSLITPELTAAFDHIARATPGFWFGRFDVRYTDRAEFKAGRGFQIIELNGVGSESTNIYDPATHYWQGQRILREQWKVAFEIGHANVQRGAKPMRVWDLLVTVWNHLQTTRDSRSD